MDTRFCFYEDFINSEIFASLNFTFCFIQSNHVALQYFSRCTCNNYGDFIDLEIITSLYFKMFALSDPHVAFF